jgi:hypothetical protein
MDNKTNKQTDAKPDGRETGNAVPPAPKTVEERIDAKVSEAINGLRKTNPKGFKHLQFMIGAHLLQEVIQKILDIPDEALEIVRDVSKARNKPTAETVAFTAQVILDAKNQLVKHASSDQAKRVVDQVGEARIREVLSPKEADEFLAKLNKS